MESEDPVEASSSWSATTTTLTQLIARIHDAEEAYRNAGTVPGERRIERLVAEARSHLTEVMHDIPDVRIWNLAAEVLLRARTLAGIAAVHKGEMMVAMAMFNPNDPFGNLHPLPLVSRTALRISAAASRNFGLAQMLSGSRTLAEEAYIPLEVAAQRYWTAEEKLRWAECTVLALQSRGYGGERHEGLLQEALSYLPQESNFYLIGKRMLQPAKHRTDARPTPRILEPRDFVL
jgi:hypothetical protein